MAASRDVDEKPDFGSTTAVIAYVRRRVTPAMLWSSIGTLVTALVFSVSWLARTQSDIRELKAAREESKKEIADLQQQFDLLHKIDTQLAVMGNKVNDIAIEVDRQRAWRERIEDVAEAAPHAKRRIAK